MSGNTNGPSGPRAGWNDPSGVTRVIMTGFYDGATNGMLQFGTAGRVFRFDLADDPTDDGCDRRTFELRLLPDDAINRFVDAVAPYPAPRWPAWVPAWSFPSADIQAEVEGRTDAILAEAGPVEWAITTEDYYSFTRFEAVVPKPVHSAVSPG